jgi:2-polyprenyl-3-methyl-5-hydroxy-6-metoxy-1,4-benzoquinol methylase
MTVMLRRVSNQGSRDHWVEKTLKSLGVELLEESPILLDAGAGQQPYRSVALENGFHYKSHDFNAYTPSRENRGLHVQWPHLNHDYVCDILEIPRGEGFHVILCTEVLEHVPDPVRTIEHLSSLLVEGGVLVTTAPILSLVHQAPYHFSSGLTTYWYERWLPKFDLEVQEIYQHGDYADLASQEIRRILRLPGVLQKPLSSIVRPFISKNLADSGGFSVFVISRKVS